MTNYVDWKFATSAGTRLAPPGPDVSPEEAVEAVEEIRALAGQTVEPVAATSRLRAPGDAPAPLVSDRRTWIEVNADSMATMFEPIARKLSAASPAPPPALAQMIGGKVTGAEAGALFAFLSSRVLGQYDLAPGGTPKLLLVAPNLVQAERELEVDPTDFRAWVCMHEETHRVQFTAVPWLREHVVSAARDLLVDMAPTPEEMAALRGFGWEISQSLRMRAMVRGESGAAANRTDCSPL